MIETPRGLPLNGRRRQFPASSISPTVAQPTDGRPISRSVASSPSRDATRRRPRRRPERPAPRPHAEACAASPASPCRSFTRHRHFMNADRSPSRTRPQDEVEDLGERQSSRGLGIRQHAQADIAASAKTFSNAK